MTSQHQALSSEHQLDLVSCCGDIRPLAGFGRLEQQFPGLGQSSTLRDVGETLKEQAARVAQRLKACAGGEDQRPAQFFFPGHAAIVALNNLSVLI